VAFRALEDAFIRGVRSRGFNHRKLSKMDANALESATSKMMECHANPTDFVKATFEAMSPDWCKQVFKVPYPPMRCLCSDGAIARWYKYDQGIVREKPSNNLRIRRITLAILKSVKWARSSTDVQASIAIALTSGVCSSYWVAAREIEGENFLLNKRLRQDIVSCVDVIESLLQTDQTRLMQLSHYGDK